MQEIQSWSKDIMARFEAGQLTEAEAAFAANQMRNSFLNQTRGELSPAGQLISTMLKREGMSLPAAIEKYAGKMFGKTTKDLTKEEMAAVCARIAERSGVSNATVNTGAKLSPIAGKAILAAAIALAIYQVATADDKLREAVVQGAGFLGFWAGAKVGAAVGGAVCAGTVVGAPACAVVGGLVGGIMGSMAAESAADYTYGAIKG